MRRSILAALVAVLLIAAPVIAGAAPSPPLLVQEYRSENPVQADPSGCYTEDSVHERIWWGSGSIVVGLDFCGPEDLVKSAGGAAFLVSVIGRDAAATITAPDGRVWQAIPHPSARKTVIRCFSGFPAGSYGGHALQGGIWTVEMIGTRAYFWVTVRSATDLWSACAGVTVDPTLY